MAKPIARAEGVAFAFPDVCLTPSPVGTVPVPYANVAQLADAEPSAKSEGTDGRSLLVGGKLVLLQDENDAVTNSSGNEAGSSGGVRSQVTQGACKFKGASSTVRYGGKGLVRFLDATDQNVGKAGANANGVVLSAFPSVLVGD